MSNITDRLFFALRPDEATRAGIEALSATLRAEQGLSGTPLKPENFHLTLYHLGDFARFPQEIFDQACAAAASIKAPAFDVVLDQAMSFKRREPKNLPCVLLAGEPLDGLKVLRAELVAALKVAGLYRYESFTPHLTLLYDNISVDKHAVAPLVWPVRELVLVQSLLRKGEHVQLASWPLQ